VIGPTVRDRAILYEEISSTADLPEGLTDEQEGGSYRLGSGMIPRSSHTTSGPIPGRATSFPRAHSLAGP
jgi:hypothetical protein